MNLSDLLYPNNPKRRQDVIDLHQQLLTCMQLNCKATNDLIGALNAHLGARITHIKMKERGSIKENCDIIIQAMNDIQQKLGNFDKEMKEKLAPGIYQKLYDIKQPELEKIATAHKIVSIVLGEATASAGAIVVKLIGSNLIKVTVNKLVALLAQIGVSVLGGMGISVLGLGIEIILRAILGAVERDHLLACIQSYEQHLAEFKEASETYQWAINEVSALVKDKAE
ncbi:LOW QUALITY PROTEIN: single-pass membrane and coiled-coil domain-containing protein 3 [Sphaerodactylus townsendi]|uniref:LOW QUALITY PROTEIN: single-pass membrane and coiled-coil domain-containing protein 3 n=1 Tax=Sphaerodactylus townsendi TaxID=933632 RepID=UPI002026C6C3|nr:LOW QUALITY PROTEIN: single-pass membrane and coiled-coil domain-containing protein 3 [Sphaerodactylus townsendi]